MGTGLHDLHYSVKFTLLMYTDQLNRTIRLSKTPRRIISLVPSQTELLFDLGLEEEIAGITKFCVHPEKWFRSKEKIGGTKTVNIEKVKALQPDLIIANKEENAKEQIEELEKIAPVWVSDVNNLDDALEMTRLIGELVGRMEKASQIAEKIKTGFAELMLHQPAIAYRTCYLIWREPYMTIGGDTFIHDMLKRCGLQNMFEDHRRYPEITLHQLQSAGCELVLLSSEPYPFKEKHVEEIKAKVPEAKVMLVDGEMFSWYGSRLCSAPAYFKALIAGL